MRKNILQIFAIFEDFIKQNMNGFAQIVVFKVLGILPGPLSWAFVRGLNQRLSPGPKSRAFIMGLTPGTSNVQA